VIDEVDFNDIKKNLCDIIVYYELPSKSCGTLVVPDEQEVLKPAETKLSVVGKVIKVILIVVVVLAVILGIIIVIFAIKAKKQQASQAEATEKTEEV